MQIRVRGVEQMASNKNDLFGGLFDLNGDGKTTIDEEFMAYQIMNECNKYKDDDISFSLPKRSKFHTVRASEKPLPEPTPGLTPKQKYESIKSSFKAEIFSCIVISLLVLFPVVAVNWAAISTYDDKNSASGFVISLFLIAGFIILGCLGKVVIPDISNSYNQVKKIEEEYLEVATDNEKKALRKRKTRKTIITWSIGILAFILLVVLLSLASDEDKSDDIHSSKYSSYSYSNSTYSGNSGYSSTRPSLNRTPAMTKEEADRLSGTGYHGCRPNSTAEDMELKAAQVKCKNCGYHSDNGSNSYCDYCQWALTHGGDLPKSDYNKTTSSSNSYSKKSYSKSYSSDDKYDVNDYSNEEDFYYDHYDDFFDYYDAEDYYKEHHK